MDQSLNVLILYFIQTAPIHCRGSIGEQEMLNFSKSLIYISDDLRWPFKKQMYSKIPIVKKDFMHNAEHWIINHPKI